MQKLVDRNAKRAKALEGYLGRRSYDLDYVGFPANLHATMIVDVKYTAPATKEFTVVSQSGSKWVINHVFKRLLETEREALEGENWKRTSLDSKNYDFTLVADGRADERCPYTLEVEPKVATKFLYRGRIWVDAEDFTVCRIEAEPAKNPSFWIQRTDISHVYLKVGNFWLPEENKSVSVIRLGGRATLTIEYQNYEVLTASPIKETSGKGLCNEVRAVGSRLRSGRRSVYEKEGHRRRPRGTEFPKATGQHAHVVRILFSLTDSHVGSCNVPNQPSLSTSTLAPVFRRLWRVPAEGLA